MNRCKAFLTALTDRGCGAALIAVLGVICFGHALWFIAALAVVYLIFGIIYTVKLM